MWLFSRPIAHRGLHNEKDTENSMAAFRNAAEKGYNIETDIHLLNDGNIVCFHDKNLKRVVGKDINITELSLNHINGNHYRLPNGETIPLLTDLIKLAEEKEVGLLIEIKTDTPSRKVLHEFLKIIKGKETFIAVQAFSPFAINWFSKKAPEFQRGLLASGIENNDFITAATDFGYGKLGLIKLAHPDFLAYNILNLPSEMVEKYVAKFGLKLLSWTVKTQENLENAKKCNVDNVIFEELDLSEGYQK